MSLERTRTLLADGRNDESPRGEELRALFVDDGSAFTDGLAVLLSSSPQLAGEIVAPEEAIAAARRWGPDVVVITCEPPDRAASIAAEDLGAPVLVLTWSKRLEDLVAAFKYEIAGLLYKDIRFGDFLCALQHVREGRRLLPPGLDWMLLEWLGQRPRAVSLGDAPTALTTREDEIVRLIVDGCSNKEIGRRLNIATQTAKNHLRNIMGKVGVESRLQLYAWAIDSGYGEGRQRGQLEAASQSY